MQTNIAYNLKRIRNRKLWTQRQLAEEAMIPFSMLQDIESMRVDPVTSIVILLCRALGCSPNELMGWKR